LQRFAAVEIFEIRRVLPEFRGQIIFPQFQRFDDVTITIGRSPNPPTLRGSAPAIRT
jgi:hypothetical protein